jgi:hypothetical protein
MCFFRFSMHSAMDSSSTPPSPSPPRSGDDGGELCCSVVAVSSLPVSFKFAAISNASLGSFATSISCLWCVSLCIALLAILLCNQV